MAFLAFFLDPAGSGNYDAVSISASTYGDVFWCSSEYSAACVCFASFDSEGTLNLGRTFKTFTVANGRVRAALAF